MTRQPHAPNPGPRAGLCQAARGAGGSGASACPGARTGAPATDFFKHLPQWTVHHSEEKDLKYFKRIRSNVPTEPFLTEIASVDDAWANATGRQDKIEVQREALAIPLRGLRKSMIFGRQRRDVHESRWTTGSVSFPVARAFLEDVSSELDADLSRAKIVCLPAGRRVYPHIDRGEYYRFRGRYHFVLKSSAGSWLKTGDEEVRMKEGELWWFDNDQMHEAFNDGDEDRIHIIFDLLPAEMRARAAASTEKARAKVLTAA